jgi:glycosyl-4,4'-diaponeurosporenoate acyltransferase
VSDRGVFALSRPWMVVLDVAVWAVWSFGVGLFAHRLPIERLGHDAGVLRLRPAELDGSFARRIRVKRWKDRLPEAGTFFAGGFSKRTVATRDPVYLERFVVETRRAEVTHWLVMAIAPVFVLWNPWWVVVVMFAYALAANGPCLVVQRYNRMRLYRVLERQQRSTRFT